MPWAYLQLGRLQLAWDSAQEFYRNDPLNIFAVGNVVLWASVLKKDDVMAEHYENIMMEMSGFSILMGYPATRVHRVDLQTAIQDTRKVLPFWGISADLADVWVRPIYDPSLRQSALEELQTFYEHGDIRAEPFWETLITLHQTDEAVNMAFDLFDQGALEPVQFWLDGPGGKEFRNHPRFMELLDYIGLASYWDDVGWPPFCELRGNQHFCGLDFEVE